MTMAIKPVATKVAGGTASKAGTGAATKAAGGKAPGTARKATGGRARGARTATSTPTPAAKSPASGAGSTADRQRQQIQAIKDARPAEAPAVESATDAPPAPSSGPSLPGALKDQTGTPAWFSKATDTSAVSITNAGGGFLLGTLLWATTLTYLRGGKPAVNAWLKAKFFNIVEA